MTSNGHAVPVQVVDALIFHILCATYDRIDHVLLFIGIEIFKESLQYHENNVVLPSL